MHSQACFDKFPWFAGWAHPQTWSTLWFEISAFYLLFQIVLLKVFATMHEEHRVNMSRDAWGCQGSLGAWESHHPNMMTPALLLFFAVHQLWLPLPKCLCFSSAGSCHLRGGSHGTFFCHEVVFHFITMKPFCLTGTAFFLKN